MVHKFTMQNIYFAIDVFSGGIHILDKLSYNLIDFTNENMTECCPAGAYETLGEYSTNDIDEAYEELYDLFKNGSLHSTDIYKPIADSMGAAPIKSMCLNIAHDCNLRCEYCFAAKGDFGQGRKLMSAEVAKKAIDFLISNSGNRYNLELDFFGGEPLMNFDVVKETVKYARGIEKKFNKNFRFTITTNGMLLDDDKIDYINREMANVVLSLDGRKFVNDKMRFTGSKKGCYDIIVPKFQKLVSLRGDKDYYARGTFTKNNLDFAEDVFHMHNLGFEQLSIEPAVTDVSLPYAISETDLPRILDEYGSLAVRLAKCKNDGGEINFFHYMLDFDGGPCAIKRLRGCSCGNEYVAITPEGDIYPCHQFVGMTEYKMGNIIKETFNNDIKDRFSKVNIYKKPECSNCFAKFFCSGGCTANNLQYENSIMTPHKLSCKLQRKRLECAILLKALTH